MTIKTETKTPNAEPVKHLALKRETVATIGIRSGLRTGGSGGTAYSFVPGVSGCSLSNIKQ